MHRTFTRRRAALAVAGVASLAVIGTSAGTYAALSDPAGATRNAGDQTAEIASEVKFGPAKNVILLIGDGMGDSEITVARDYLKGAAGRFEGIDALPLTGQYTTYSLHKKGTKLFDVDYSGKPDYDPESASTASAWSTGTKTYDGSLAVDLDNVAQRSLLKLAKEKGLKVGDVTTSEIQDATPAAQYAAINERGCYSPARLTDGCKNAGFTKSITEQLLDVRPDVTLGGGATYFGETVDGKDNKVGGKTLDALATEQGFQKVTDKAGLAGLTEASQTKPVLGLFAPGNLPTNFKSANAVKDGNKKAPVTCEANPARPATQPSLADMTDKAIKLLDNTKGFFLQVEGASIDKRDHASDACGQIGETDDLDKAVKVALDYAKAHRDTAVFLTADHAHTSQIVEVNSTSPGVSINLINPAADNAPLAVNYGTTAVSDPTSPTEVDKASQQHTGSQLRIAGYGPGAANIVGLTDNTDVFFTVSRLLGLGNAAAGPLDKAPVPPTVVRTVTKQVVPAALKASVAKKIKTLTTRAKRAKGAKKRTLKAQLSAYRQIQRSLR